MKFEPCGQAIPKATSVSRIIRLIFSVFKIRTNEHQPNSSQPPPRPGHFEPILAEKTRDEHFALFRPHLAHLTLYATLPGF